MTMKEKKEDKVDINCMLHKCKRCPKQRECEERAKKNGYNNKSNNRLHK